MAKRRRGSRSTRDTKVMIEREDASIDLISMLPDALLVSILSNLTFKESAATSILSQRWRYLWTLVPKLDFDGSKSLMRVRMETNKELAIQEERSKYFRWLDHVMALHKSCAIEELQVYFHLDKSCEKYIDKWVTYALARKVKRLELDLCGLFGIGVSGLASDDCFTFPFNHTVPETLDAVEVKDCEEEILPKDKKNCPNDLLLHRLRQYNLIHFKYLEKISLNRVNVNGEAVEFFLRNCPLLEHLSVTKSIELSSLKIIGPYPSLKHLEIHSCKNLSSFEVRDTNLVYLKYVGNIIQQFLLKNVPLLVEMYIGGSIEVIDVMLMFSSILPQLEKLTFLNCWICGEVGIKMFCSAVKMSNLKQLVLMPIFGDSLLPLTNILCASPCLETLVLMGINGRIRKRMSQKKEGSYTHLKEVIFRNYYGSTGELELVMHLSESAGALEKIVIDPHKNFGTFDEYYRDNTPGEYDIYIRRLTAVRARAKKQLVGKLPPRINLQIL